MSYLYKRSNRFWHLLIRHDLVHKVWSPLVHLTRRRRLQAGGARPGPRERCSPRGCESPAGVDPFGHAIDAPQDQL